MTMRTTGRRACALAARLALLTALGGGACLGMPTPTTAATDAAMATVTLNHMGRVVALAVDARDHRALALQTNGPATLIDTRAMVAVGALAAPDDASATVYDPAADAFIVYETRYYPGTRLAAYGARDGRRLYGLQLHLAGAQYIQAVAVDPGARVVYALMPAAGTATSGQLTIIDDRTGRVRRVVSLSGAPRGLLAVDPATGHVFVPAAADTLLEYGGERPARATGVDRAVLPLGAVRAVPLSGTPAAIVADGATGRVFVADQTGNRVAVFDAASGAALRDTSVGAGPQALALDGPGRRLYVADKTGGAVDVLDTRTGRRLRAAPVGSAPDTVAVDAPRQRVYVRCDDGIAAIDLRTGRRAIVVPAPMATGGSLAIDDRAGVTLVGSGPFAGAATVTLIDDGRS